MEKSKANQEFSDNLQTKDINYYKEEIKRKQKEIEELKKKNEILLRTALKGAQRIEEMRERLEKHTKSN